MKTSNSSRTVLVAGLTLLTLAAAIGAALFTLHSGPALASVPAAAPAAVPVSVATVAASNIATWDEFSGRLEAIDRVELRARVAGSVQAVHFREGSLVKAGDLLFTIDPAPYAAEVERAEAQLAAARSRQTHSNSEQQRAQRLWQEGAIAQREFDERANTQREADASVRAAAAALQSAQLNLAYTQVRAPIGGRIGRIEVTVGNLVAAGPGAPVLTRLNSVHPIYASFEADEKVVTRALKSLGARASIERIPVQMALGTAADTAAPLGGKLQLVDNQVDSASGTVRVRAVFDNADGSLIPGQYARLRMGQPEAAAALLINERAVGTDQNKRFVLVVGADERIEWREVTLGASVNGLRLVTQGLKAGERIVVGGVQRVRPGTLVQAQPVAMDARPA